MDEVIFEEFKGTGISEVILIENYQIKEFFLLLTLLNLNKKRRAFSSKRYIIKNVGTEKNIDANGVG